MMFRRCIISVMAVLCLSGLGTTANVPGLWLDVPFVQQTKEGCGAASIAMVMQYWLHQQGRTTDESANAEQIQRTLYSPKAHGIYASEMERYFQQQGFRTFAFHGDWDEVKHHLAQGRPLIVALKPTAGDASLHYLVVVGLEEQDGIVLVNDPAQRKLLKQDRASFEHEWNATGKWTLLAVPQSPSDAH